MVKLLPASKQSIAKRKPLHGVGINDAWYITKVGSWMCPYYSRWRNMLGRCYSKPYQERNPTYIGCSVSKDWLLFSTFRSWMEQQDWEGNYLDKDIAYVGNKVYSVGTCMFVTPRVNSMFIKDNNLARRLPTNVSEVANSNKYSARGCDGVNRIARYLGIFDSIDDAEFAALSFKVEVFRKEVSKGLCKDELLLSAYKREIAIMEKRKEDLELILLNSKEK